MFNGFALPLALWHLENELVPTSIFSISKRFLRLFLVISETNSIFQHLFRVIFDIFLLLNIIAIHIIFTFVIKIYWGVLTVLKNRISSRLRTRILILVILGGSWVVWVRVNPLMFTLFIIPCIFTPFRDYNFLWISYLFKRSSFNWWTISDVFRLLIPFFGW